MQVVGSWRHLQTALPCSVYLNTGLRQRFGKGKPSYHSASEFILSNSNILVSSAIVSDLGVILQKSISLRGACKSYNPYNT